MNLMDHTHLMNQNNFANWVNPMKLVNLDDYGESENLGKSDESALLDSTSLERLFAH